MGTYYDVDKVKSSGRKLLSKHDGLSNGEKLVMVLDRTIHNMAVDVTSPGEFDEFTANTVWDTGLDMTCTHTHLS